MVDITDTMENMLNYFREKGLVILIILVLVIIVTIYLYIKGL